MIKTTFCLFGLLLFLGTTRAVTEVEPNDDHTAPDYAGGLGPLGNTPLVVNGTVAAYGLDDQSQLDGDIDRHRFTLNETSLVSAVLEGFEGNPVFFLLTADNAVAGIGAAGEGRIKVPATELGPGTYFAFVAGATGPDNDPYALTIQRVTDGALAIRKATVKFNTKKPDRDSAKVVALFSAPTIDPVANGLSLSFLGRTWTIEPDRFAPKGARFIYKGAKGEVLKKIVIDPAKGKLSITLKKGELGEPRDGEAPDANITVRMESGSVLMVQTVLTMVKKDGRVLVFK